MCRPTRCKQCHKTTWAGCGQHIATVKATVPADRWCPGHSKTDAPSQSKGLFGRLFRK